jgi:hypothetical protein
MPLIDATHEEIAFCLGYFYPGMLFTLSGTEYNDLVILPGSPVPKPTLADIQSHIPEARQLILAQRAYDLKVGKFQQTYDLQKQVVTILTALQSASTFAAFKADVNIAAMRTLWNSL